MTTQLTETDDDTEWLKELRILYVEDEEGIRLQLGQFLKRRVQDVIIAHDGREGLALFAEHKPDIVITDLLMPNMNGLEMTEAILKINPRTPVIITTAFNEIDYLLKAIDLGVEAYVIKPIQTERLTRCLLKCARNLSFEAAYRKGNQLLRLILSSLNEAVFIINAETKQLTYCNQMAETLFGYTQPELIGQMAGILYIDQGHLQRSFADILKTCVDSGSYECQGRLRRKNGEIFPCEHSVRPIIGASATEPLQLVYVVRDITLQKRAENVFLEHQAQLDFLANHDPLTGLSNRRCFQDRLKNALARSRRLKTHLAVLFIDLDKFKPVNDRFGHEVGDDLLRTVAGRLSLIVREQDTLGRFGGDEFVLIIEDVRDVSAVTQVAEKLIRALDDPFEISGHQLCVGASVGISLFPSFTQTATEDGESLIHRADQAMYRAKLHGGDGFCLYEGDTEEFTCQSQQG